MRHDVLIIGGGIAGISSAIWAIENGLQPLIIEKNNHLGGRASTLLARDVDSRIDIGQHILSASYYGTRELLKRLGTENKIYFQKKLQINFKLSYKNNFYFKCWSLPNPAHFFIPLFVSQSLSPKDKWALLKCANFLRKANLSDLKNLTVKQLVEKMGSTRLLNTLIWEPITVATLNTSVNRASAYLLFQVLNKAFLTSAEGSGLGIPRDFLEEIFGNPAKEFISKNGGVIHFRTSVKKLKVENNIVKGIISSSGQYYSAQNIIMALPPDSLFRIFVNSNIQLNNSFPNDGSIEYSPIITFNVWFKNPIDEIIPLAFINSSLQWLFKFPHQFDGNKNSAYTVVMSASEKEVHLDNKSLLNLIRNEFMRFFRLDLYSDLNLIKYKILKVRTATIVQSPELLDKRLPTNTKFRNLYIAGDWIESELPATIESAALSGKLAIEAIKDKIISDPQSQRYSASNS
jgi:zeta-carotene desaturase